jgi:ParB family transcriptional regulator, chromosome partitioning protein
VPERRDIHIDLLLEPPVPVRMAMDETKLHELAEDIKKRTVLQNLVVVTSDGKYEIIAGHRRYLAARIAGLSKLPCLIFEDLADAKYAVMLSENGFREDVTAAEEGAFFLDLAEKHGWSEEQICHHVDRSANYVNERVKLVREFPEVMKHVAARELNWSQAKAIMRCKILRWQPYLLEQAITHGATAKALGYMVDQFQVQESLGAATPAPHTAESAPVFIEPDKARCVWCQRNDDQGNVTQIPVHNYHVRDLTEFLRATGVHQRSPASPPTDPAAA